eukprot:g2427.t1
MGTGKEEAKPAARSRRGPTLDINAIASGKYDVRSAIQGDADAQTILTASIERARKEGSALDLKIKHRKLEADRLRMKLVDFARNGAALEGWGSNERVEDCPAGRVRGVSIVEDAPRRNEASGRRQEAELATVKQIRVLSRQFRLVDIDLVRVASGAGDKDEMLNPAEFVEALIRLAIRRYAFAEIASETPEPPSEGPSGDNLDEDPGGSEVAKTTRKSRKIADRVRRLLLENVCAHAQLVDIDNFRMRFADPGVQRAIHTRRRWLVGKFREYCAADASQAATSDQAMHTMSLGEWEKFLRDHRMFDARFRNRTAATLFVCAQAPNLMEDENLSLEDALPRAYLSGVP